MLLILFLPLLLCQAQEGQGGPVAEGPGPGPEPQGPAVEPGEPSVDDNFLPNAASDSEAGPPLTEEHFKKAAILLEKLAQQSDEEKMASYVAAMAYHQESITPEEPGKENRIVPREVVKRWPNGIVPYTMEGGGAFDDEFKTLIAAAIKEVGDKTCVQWRPKIASDKNWVHIKSTGTTGCVGTLSYNEWMGEHKLDLMGGNDKSKGYCRNKGTIIHEMMHNLGFDHEHTRPDRDTYVTVTWPNLVLAKAFNHWKNSWATDPTNIPKCKLEGQVQASADFSNCVSGSIVEDFGVGYDYHSIMHYFTWSSGVIGSDGFAAKVLTAKDPSITGELGGSELTDKDVMKIRKAYGCDGCGMRQKSDTGGDLTGSGSDAKSPCEWLLETTPGKGIEIDISEISGATSDCSTNYLEVRLGDNNQLDTNGAKVEAPLVGKYCSTAGTVKINNFKIWVKWVRPTASLATSALKAKWTTFAVACCDKMFIKGLGSYSKETNPVNGYPVYKAEKAQTGKDFLFFSNYGWRIGAALPKPDGTYSQYYQNEGLQYCPDEVTGPWKEWKSSAWTAMSESQFVRCSDCAKYPAADECATCCDEVTSTYTDLGDNTDWIKNAGNEWKMFQTDANGYKVYKSTADARFCVYVNPANFWALYNCAEMTTTNIFGYADATKCVRQTTGWKFWKNGAWTAADLTFACKGGNPVPPTAAPTLAPPTAAPTVAPTIAPTVAPTVAPLPTSKAPAVQCLPCKTVSSGPADLQGTYTLDAGNTQATRTDCKDSCVYKKGADTFCFSAGGFPVEPTC